MSKTKTKLTPHSIYPFNAESRIEGWPGSGFAQRLTQLQARRVEVDGEEQVQIEISIFEFKGQGNRMYTHSGAMVLDAWQAATLLDALQTVKRYK
jgi:hypothetical protein